MPRRFREVGNIPCRVKEGGKALQGWGGTFFGGLVGSGKVRLGYQ